jgi:hypothetical protein
LPGYHPGRRRLQSGYFLRSVGPMTLLPRSPSPSAVAVLLAALAAGPALAAADGQARWIEVPPGNRSATQPAISLSSLARTAETKGDFESKYRSIYDQLAAEKELIAKIVKIAGVYDIDPIHIVGAIVGEHTYNVDVFDDLQGYYVKALAYLGTGGLRFAYGGEPIETFVARPQFEKCADAKDDYALWSCRERVWRTDFKGKMVGGVAFPDDRFERVFFQPFYAGQTFGLGQLSPLTALMVSDIVHDKAGLPALDMQRAPEVYQAVMDPDMTLNYMAAIIRRDIDAYRAVAGFDISKNPGVTATLYNVGEAEERAAELAAENRKRHAAGLGILFPRENYYGWLVNARLEELQKLFAAN